MNVEIFEKTTENSEYPALGVNREYNIWRDENRYYKVKEIKTHLTKDRFVMVVIYEG